VQIHTESINQPVTVEEVAALGDITLDVWADAGEEKTMKILIPKFEAYVSKRKG